MKGLFIVMDNFKIEKANREDSDIITNLLDTVFLKDFLNYGYKPPSYQRPIEKTLELIDFGHTYIGYLNSVPVSTVSVYPAEKEGFFEVKALVTLPEYQGKGIGKKMMNFVHNNSVNTQLFTLTTPVDNKSNFKFYTDFGYKVVGEFLEFNNPIYIFEKVEWKVFGL